MNEIERTDTDAKQLEVARSRARGMSPAERVTALAPHCEWIEEYMKTPELQQRR